MFGKLFAVATVLATAASPSYASECQLIDRLDDFAKRSVPPLIRGKVALTEAFPMDEDWPQRGKPDIATEMKLRGKPYLICPEYPD